MQSKRAAGTQGRATISVRFDLVVSALENIDTQKGQRSRYKQTKVEKDWKPKGDVIV
jgi:hypothetical protein